MRLLAWLDGEVFVAEKLRIGTPYVQQRIHTFAGVAHNLDHHIAVLRRTTEELFGFASLCSVKDAQRIIGKLVELSRVGSSLSVPVVMRLDADASLSFEVERPTFGCGGYLRAKRDVGVTYTMSQPMFDAETQASVALDRMADFAVHHLGGQRAIWVNSEGYLLSRPWQPIYVYYKQCWFTPKRYDSVEFCVMERAIKAAGYKLLVRDIPESALEMVDEVFTADIMGISSFSSIKNHRLLSSITIRIASKMEPII
ncbi:MAG: hypothetical protein IKV29_06750 [Alistipes sp.]|nr:hypothetical protein [Alistipes sp.]